LAKIRIATKTQAKNPQLFFLFDFNTPENHFKGFFSSSSLQVQAKVKNNEEIQNLKSNQKEFKK
jgi:hypothetical protein